MENSECYKILNKSQKVIVMKSEKKGKFNEVIMVYNKLRKIKKAKNL